MSAGPAIQLSQADLDRLLAETKADLVRHLITQHADALDFITPAQAGGILNVNPKTLSSIPRSKLPRYDLIPGKVCRYKLSEVVAYLEAAKA